MLATSDDATLAAIVDQSRVRIMSESSLLLERSTDRTRELPLTASDRVSVDRERQRWTPITETLAHGDDADAGAEEPRGARVPQVAC